MFALGIRKAAKPLFAAVLALSIAGCSTNSSKPPSNAGMPPPASTADNTYDKDTVLKAARDAFGDGAEGLGEMIEKAFSENGRPNGYIVGEEAGGGLVLALRYGAGTLYHKIEGTRPAHWTGPSIGFEAGASGAKVFTLVYNLYDTEELYKRYPAIEGQFYFIGGVGMNYLQNGDVKLAQIRLGVGLRATANLGWIKFTKEKTWNPL